MRNPADYRARDGAALSRPPAEHIIGRSCLFPHSVRRFFSKFRRFSRVFDQNRRISSLLAPLCGGVSSTLSIYALLQARNPGFLLGQARNQGFFLCILPNLLRSFDEFSDFVIFELIFIEYFAQIRFRMAPRLFFADFRAIWSEFCYEVGSLGSRKK